MSNIIWTYGAPGRCDIRLATVKIGMEAELRGFRLTSKAPPCFTICKQYGLDFKRGAEKILVYEAFVAGIGREDAKRFDRDGEGKAFECPVGPRRVDRPAVKVSRARKRLDRNETAVSA